jgi:nucleotide-binding universal stress UspA family protein
MAEMATERAIVAGVDASEACLGAARWAAREAVLRGVTLRLVHACIFGPDDPADHDTAAHHDEEPLLEHGYRWIERAERAATEAAPGVRIETEVNPGIAPDLLVDESAKADLIVVGSHGVGGLRGVFIGSVALKVAAQASCPVVVVHGESPPCHGPVVAGVDASEESEHALEFALAAASLRAVPLLVVHAWHDGILAAGADLGAVESSELRALEDRLAGWCEKYPEVEVRLHAVRDRNVARALLLVTPDAQLIVIGSRGRGPVAGGLLGSTGNSLISRSACPVVVIHERNRLMP